MSDFSNSKVGDKVWDLILGECEVESIKDGKIHVLFIFEDNSKSRLSYDFKGFSTPEIKVQLLYHSKPQIIEAKRMVKKEIDVLIYRYGKTNDDILIGFDLEDPNYLCKAKLTFEVEE